MALPVLVWVLGIYFLLSGAALYVLIMGQSRYHRHGIIGRASQWLRDFPSRVARVCCLTMSCGNAAAGERRLHAASHHCGETANPWMQLFYCAITGGGMFFLVRDVVPAHPSAVQQAACLWLCAAAGASFILASVSDPGIVPTREERANLTPAALELERRRDTRFKHDGAMFVAGADCFTCHAEKPARSKHCRLCGRCVRRFDHHCPWINNDVGEDNLRWFHAFLLVHIVLCAHAAWLCATSLMHFVRTERLLEATFVDKAGNRMGPSWPVLAVYVLRNNVSACAVGLFAAIVAVMLVVFWWMNFALVLKNITANEQQKHDDLEEMVRDQAAQDARRAASQGGAVSTPAVTMADVEAARRFYHRGIMRNMWEAFVPSYMPSVPPAPATNVDTKRKRK
jgi:palmitoyltransferase